MKYTHIYFIWRPLNALSDCQYIGDAFLGRYEQWHIDVGYCLDRYISGEPQ
jgi:hypothetical protein